MNPFLTYLRNLPRIHKHINILVYIYLKLIFTHILITYRDRYTIHLFIILEETNIPYCLSFILTYIFT